MRIIDDYEFIMCPFMGSVGALSGHSSSSRVRRRCTTSFSWKPPFAFDFPRSHAREDFVDDKWWLSIVLYDGTRLLTHLVQDHVGLGAPFLHIQACRRNVPLRSTPLRSPFLFMREGYAVLRHPSYYVPHRSESHTKMIFTSIVLPFLAYLFS